MNDYSKTYFHLKKSQSFMNKDRLNTDNKSEIKFEKFKKITKPKDNLNIKHRILKKMSQHHYKRNNQHQNQPTKKISKEKYKQENKKITHNKSFNLGRNRQNEFNLQTNNTYIPKEKSIKKIKLNNNEIFFDNYDKNLLHRKIYKNNNENNNHLTKINNTSQLDGKKFSNSYFNVLYKKEKNDDFFSRSQNFGNKKNALRRINTNLSVNKDKHNTSVFNAESDFNKSQTNFYSNKKLSNDFFRSKLLINNDYFNNNNNLVTEVNINKEEINNSNNFNSINNCDNSTPINNHKPIKLYKDKYKDSNNNTTTFNLPGSFNFHQYFNTIINKTNNYNKRNIINRNYNKNLASIESNNKLYNNCQTQICNTNESDNKLNTLTVNDPKFIDEINGLNNDLENELKKNQTNSKSQKYNTIKRSFDKFIKTINEFFLNNDLHPIFIYLQKILIGYHDVILAFSGENRKLKELNYKLSEQYQKIDKNFIESNKTIKEKQNEIENLGKKISLLLTNLNEQKRINIILKCKLEEMNINNIKNNNFELNDSVTHKNMNDIEKTEQYIKIKNINMNNLDDLDSLYFWDKIYMKPKRAFSHGKIIPFLPINNINK